MNSLRLSNDRKRLVVYTESRIAVHNLSTGATAVAVPKSGPRGEFPKFGINNDCSLLFGLEGTGGIVAMNTDGTRRYSIQPHNGIILQLFFFSGQ
ncbi:hypothetical protein FM036_45100 [Nostoc sp. HG1]|nr:hypothetical protein [Nostoc sp. HG1]